MQKSKVLFMNIYVSIDGKQILLLHSHWDRSWEIWTLNLDQSQTSDAAWANLSYQGKSVDFVVLKRQPI